MFWKNINADIWLKITQRPQNIFEYAQRKQIWRTKPHSKFVCSEIKKLLSCTRSIWSQAQYLPSVQLACGGLGCGCELLLCYASTVSRNYASALRRRRRAKYYVSTSEPIVRKYRKIYFLDALAKEFRIENKVDDYDEISLKQSALCYYIKMCTSLFEQARTDICTW